MSVSTRHEEYKDHLSRWEFVRDFYKGSDAVKKKKEKYLPKPNAQDNTPQNDVRYSQYLERANYFNVIGRTSKSFVGAIFRKPLLFSAPTDAEYINDSATADGISIEQLSKLAVSEINKTGRCGLLVDYPNVDQGMSIEQSNSIYSTISLYTAESIINWETTNINGKSVLTMVVLEEDVQIKIDQFESETEKQYRVLLLVDGFYTQLIYINDEFTSYTPTDKSGNKWLEIPFTFVGADDNTPSVDCAPLYDLAQISLGHYRNSADYEEGVFIHGQGTMFISSEMSNETFKAANPQGIIIGARAGHHLGPNGNATLLQMSANNAAREAMLDKRDEMVLIGARLITSKASNETAEAARIAASSEASVLSTIATNVEDAIKQSIKYVCVFMGCNGGEVEFELNKDFFDKTLTAQDIIASIQLADRGDIARSDVRHSLRRSGFFKKGRTDEEIDSEVLENPPLTFNNEM